MEFQVVNKYLREADKTFVAIRCQDPYTAYDRILEGDRMAESDESLIEAVKKIVATEMDLTGAITEMQQKVDVTAELAKTNKELTGRMDKIQSIFIEYIISTGNMPFETYKSISALLPELKAQKRYLTGNIVQAKYPYDTNPKYLKGEPVILKFIDNYNYNGEAVTVLLQRGAVSIIIPQV